MTNRLLMVDLSSNNALVDLDAHWRAGFRRLMLKVTEGVGYAWSAHGALAAQWHRFGGIIDHYHFLHPWRQASGPAQADWFWTHVRPTIGVGDQFVLDAETDGENGGETAGFIDRIHLHAPTVGGRIYGGPYFLRDNAITGHRGWGLHIAAYPTVPFIPPGFADWDAHQFTQSGTAVGIGGGVDVSHLKPRLLQPGLHYGNRCFAVADAKVLLRAAGYRGFSLGDTFGPGMRVALYRFKRDHGWPKDECSGRVLGRHAWAALGRYAR